MELMAEEKKEFKKTDLGLIPNDWSVENFTDYCWFQEGPGLRKWQFTKQGMKVINVTNLQEDRTLDLDKTDRHISIEEFENNYQHFEIDQDDIVMASSGNSYCKTSIVQKKDLPLMMNTSVIRFKPRENLDYDYLLSYLTSPYFKDQIDLLITGGAQPNFGPYHLKRINLPIPQSIQEQKAIGKALSDVYELIRSLDGLIQKKQAIKKGTMQQLLSGKKRLPGFDGVWEVKTLGECFDFLKTGTQSRSALNSYGDFGYIHYGDIHSKWDLFLDCDKQKIPKIDSDKVKSLPQLQEGDLIIADASEDYEGVGKSIEIKNISGEKIVAGLHTMLLRAKNESLADGYKAYITSIESVKKKLAQIATGTTVYGLSKTKLKEVEIYLPKSVEEQKIIAQILSDMDRELQTLRQKREKYVQIKQGMMQELLTGKTRLM